MRKNNFPYPEQTAFPRVKLSSLAGQDVDIEGGALSLSAAAIYFIILSTTLSLNIELQKIVLRGNYLIGWDLLQPYFKLTLKMSISYFQVMKSIYCISVQHTE